jgi:hypothetical protein
MLTWFRHGQQDNHTLEIAPANLEQGHTEAASRNERTFGPEPPPDTHGHPVQLEQAYAAILRDRDDIYLSKERHEARAAKLEMARTFS